MDVIVKGVESVQEMEAVYSIRTQVFVEEQGVPREMELDPLDDTAFHAIALQDGAAVGTGRLIMETVAQGTVGRMAVALSFRRRGIGARVLSFLEAEAQSQGILRITLHAQSYVKEFYARHGYREESEPFLEAGIQHVQMSKALT